jgi:hypothetical protein
VCAAGPLEAQQEERSPIATGRPRFATGPGIVPSFQVEAGYEFTDDSATNQHTVGQLMLRFPVSSRLEVRARLGSLVLRDVTGTTTQGFQDVAVSAKLQLLAAGETGPLIPAVALLGATSLPTSNGPFGSDQIQPSVNLILGWPVGDRAQVLSNTIFRSRFGQDERFGEVAQGLYLGYDLPGPVGTFVEVYGSRAEGRDASSSLGLGLTYLLNRDLQLDVHGGRGLNSAADAFYVEAGIGWRW